jgi:hypothetical protein
MLRFFKQSSFWQRNRLILREFKYFRRVAVLAIVFMGLAAVFEGFGIGFLLSFLQNLTAPRHRQPRLASAGLMVGFWASIRRSSAG